MTNLFRHYKECQFFTHSLCSLAQLLTYILEMLIFGRVTSVPLGCRIHYVHYNLWSWS